MEIKQLIDQQILEIFNPQRNIFGHDAIHGDSKKKLEIMRAGPQFTIADLVGKTLGSYRKIENPKSYNPEFESPNPEYFDILQFTDGSMLWNEKWGDGECGHLDSFYYNGERVLYSDQLFGL